MPNRATGAQHRQTRGSGLARDAVAFPSAVGGADNPVCLPSAIGGPDPALRDRSILKSGQQCSWSSSRMAGRCFQMDKWATVVAGVAIYGAVLSTIVAVWQCVTRRPRLRVTARRVITQTSEPFQYQFTAANVGTRTVKLNGVRLDFGDGMVFAIIPDPLSSAWPSVLTDGQDCNIFLPEEAILSTIADHGEPVAVTVSDVTGRAYHAKWRLKTSS